MSLLTIIQTILYLGLTQVIATPEQLTLYAESISNPTDSIALTQFEIDYERVNLTTIPNTTNQTPQINVDGLYCIKFDNGECFSLIEFNLPLSYELIWDYEINEFSLIYNETLTINDTNVIIGQVRNSTFSDLADVTKLKKITKTYADKKKELSNVVVDKESDDKEDGEEKSWMEENWKKIVVGIVLYNLVTLGFKKQSEPTEGKKD